LAEDGRSERRLAFTIGANASRAGTKSATVAIESARRTYAPFFASAHAAAATATAILAQFDVVGVMDHLDALQTLLATTLDLRGADGGRIEPQHTNTAMPPPQDQEGDGGSDGDGHGDGVDGLAWSELLQQTPVSQAVHKVWKGRWEAEYGGA